MLIILIIRLLFSKQVKNIKEKVEKEIEKDVRIIEKEVSDEVRAIEIDIEKICQRLVNLKEKKKETESMNKSTNGNMTRSINERIKDNKRGRYSEYYKRKYEEKI